MEPSAQLVQFLTVELPFQSLMKFLPKPPAVFLVVSPIVLHALERAKKAVCRLLPILALSAVLVAVAAFVAEHWKLAEYGVGKRSERRTSYPKPESRNAVLRPPAEQRFDFL